MTDLPGWQTRSATDPFPTDPYATDPYRTDPYATDPYAAVPYPSPPPAAGPYAYLPPGHAPAGWYARPLTSVTGLGWAVVTVGAVWLLLAVVEAVAAWDAAPRFAAAVASGAEQPWTGYDTAGLVLVAVQLLALVLTGLWLTAVRRNVDAVAPGSQRRGVVWAWLGWLVPVVSFWFPYQVVADAGRASTRAGLAYGGWWAAFLLFLLAQQVQTVVAGGVTGDVDPSVVASLPVAAAASTVLLAVAFALWARIVLTVSRAHARWAVTQVPTVD